MPGGGRLQDNRHPSVQVHRLVTTLSLVGGRSVEPWLVNGHGSVVGNVTLNLAVAQGLDKHGPVSGRGGGHSGQIKRSHHNTS